MARLVIENISLDVARELAHWYEGAGEQYAHEWMLERGLRAPLTDVARKGGWLIEGDGETVTLYCKG